MHLPQFVFGFGVCAQRLEPSVKRASSCSTDLFRAAGTVGGPVRSRLGPTTTYGPNGCSPQRKNPRMSKTVVVHETGLD